MKIRPKAMITECEWCVRYDSEGLIQNVTINFNETKLVEGVMNYANSSGVFK